MFIWLIIRIICRKIDGAMSGVLVALLVLRYNSKELKHIFDVLK